MKFFDDKNKNLRWWNRNYFYVGTIVIIAVNILLFVLLDYGWDSEIVSADDVGNWEAPLYLNRTIASFFSSFSHANWQHVLLNMLCFAACGLYLERKAGTFGILGIVLFGAYASGVAITANYLSCAWLGFSGVNYFLYAYILFDFIFCLKKEKRNKTNTILGAVILFLIYVAMCFNGGVEGFGFELYPYDLIYNCGHYCGFLMGCAIALFKNIIEITVEKSVKRL